ncbi:MAG: hypothetical protein Q9163_005305 [Psora crenata]
MERLAAKLSPSKGVKNISRRLTWAFDKSDVNRAFTSIERVKTLVNIALNNDLYTISTMMAKELSGLNDGVASLQNDQQLGHRRNLESWLSKIDFNARQQEILRARTPGTGEWLLESPLFQLWVGSEGCKRMWCPGIPGGGKTVMSSMIVDHLTSKFKSSARIAVTCLFCNYKEQSEQTAEAFLANLIKQLIQVKPPPDELWKLYERKPPSSPSWFDLCRVLQAQLPLFDHVYVIIDALDETEEESSIRQTLLPFLMQDGLPIKLLVTSRDERSIESIFEPFVDSLDTDSEVQPPSLDASLACIDSHEEKVKCTARLRIKASDADLCSYITSRINSASLLARHVKKEPSLGEEIVEKVIQGAKDMYVDSLITVFRCGNSLKACLSVHLAHP